MLAVVIDISSC